MFKQLWDSQDKSKVRFVLRLLIMKAVAGSLLSVLSGCASAQSQVLNYTLEDVRAAYSRGCFNDTIYKKNNCQYHALTKAYECVSEVERKCNRRSYATYPATRPEGE